MNNPLRGQCLTWVTFDPELTYSAALRSMLSDRFEGLPIRMQVDVAKSLEEAAQWISRQQVGLLTLVVDNPSVVLAAKCFWQCRMRSPTTVRIAVARDPSAEIFAFLVESGAQIVVTEIPSLQRLLPHIVERIRLKSIGFHPLTSGLLERLPWREVGV